MRKRDRDKAEDRKDNPGCLTEILFEGLPEFLAVQEGTLPTVICAVLALLMLVATVAYGISKMFAPKCPHGMRDGEAMVGDALRCPECEKIRQLRRAQFSQEMEAGRRNPSGNSPESGRWICPGCAHVNAPYDEYCTRCFTPKTVKKEKNRMEALLPFLMK